VIGCSPNCGGGAHIQACPNHHSYKPTTVIDELAVELSSKMTGYTGEVGPWLLMGDGRLFAVVDLHVQISLLWCRKHNSPSPDHRNCTYHKRSARAGWREGVGVEVTPCVLVPLFYRGDDK
jgi:hypothetical protein